MSNKTAKLLAWLVLYNMTATNYQAHLDAKHIQLHPLSDLAISLHELMILEQQAVGGR